MPRRQRPEKSGAKVLPLPAPSVSEGSPPLSPDTYSPNGQPARTEYFLSLADTALRKSKETQKT